MLYTILEYHTTLRLSRYFSFLSHCTVLSLRLDLPVDKGNQAISKPRRGCLCIASSASSCSQNSFIALPKMTIIRTLILLISLWVSKIISRLGKFAAEISNCLLNAVQLDLLSSFLHIYFLNRLLDKISFKNNKTRYVWAENE